MNKVIFVLLFLLACLASSASVVVTNNATSQPVLFQFYQADQTTLISEVENSGGVFAVPVAAAYVFAGGNFSANLLGLDSARDWALVFTSVFLEPVDITQAAAVFGMSIVFCCGVWLGTLTWRIWKAV